jgi:hypothetical protein
VSSPPGRGLVASAVLFACVACGSNDARDVVNAFVVAELDPSAQRVDAESVVVACDGLDAVSRTATYVGSVRGIRGWIVEVDLHGSPGDSAWHDVTNCLSWQPSRHACATTAGRRTRGRAGQLGRVGDAKSL